MQATIDEIGEIEDVSLKHNYTKIRTKLLRKNEVNDQLRLVKAATLTKYHKNKRDSKRNQCKVKIQWTIEDIHDGKLMTDLESELKKQGERRKATSLN